MAETYDLKEYLSLKKFDEISVTMDFIPNDGITKIETVKGLFIMHAENLPAGWIPFSYIVLENGIVGWMQPKVIKLIKRYSVKDSNSKEFILKVIGAIDSIQIQMKEAVDLLQLLENELRAYVI